MQSLIIGLREGLEALILIFLLSNTRKNESTKWKISPIMSGSLVGVILAFIVGFVIVNVKGLKYFNHDIFEFGLEVVIFISIVYLLFTMSKMTTKVFGNLESVNNLSNVSLFLICFSIGGREAVEVVMFNLSLGTTSWVFSLIGVLLAFIIAKVIVGLKNKVSLKLFFKITNIYIILLCSYLFGHMINLGIELHYFNLPNFQLYDLSKTFLNSHSVIGYVIKIITSWPYKVNLSAFVGQYVVTIIMLSYYFINEKLRKQNR